MAKCPDCGRTFKNKTLAIEHIGNMHPDRLDKVNLSAGQYLYASTHNGDFHGKCMVCGKPTEWSERTSKPYKLCGNPDCKKKLAEIAAANLMKARHITHRELLSNMGQQQKMLANRRISGMYKFADGGEVGYTAKLELSFLKFCDIVMDLKSMDFAPIPEAFSYHDSKTDTERFFIPDFYMPQYDLLVEIKDGGEFKNENPKFLEETRYKVYLKDEAMRHQTKYNYIRISGTKYGPFLAMLYDITHRRDIDDNSKIHTPLIVINESACVDPEEFIQCEDNVNVERVLLLIGYAAGTRTPLYIGITDLTTMSSWYVSNLVDNSIKVLTFDDPLFAGTDYDMFQYIGDEEKIKKALPIIAA